MSEWLRRVTRNHLGSARTGSNPVGVACFSVQQKPGFFMDQLAISKLQAYVQIPTVHPDPDYGPAVEFLIDYAKELGLSAQVIALAEGKPAVLMEWSCGNCQETILLNSHMDVVPVERSEWTVDPFAASIKDGFIYGRGVQDMKSIGISYLEAIRRLQQRGFTPRRRIVLSFVPDEEIGAVKGMQILIKRPEFQRLQVSLALDEGYANPEWILVHAQERAPNWLEVECRGPTGHGSLLLKNTAMEKAVFASS